LQGRGLAKQGMNALRKPGFKPGSLHLLWHGGSLLSLPNCTVNFRTKPSEFLNLPCFSRA
jgi:hypothetical protein